VSKNSKIQWCDHTFNIAWGCSEKFENIDGNESMDPACRNCYARGFAKRVGQDVWGADKPRRVFGEKHWAEPLAWNRAAMRYPDQCLKCSARLCIAAQQQSGNHVCPSQRDERGKFDPNVPACGGEVALNVRPRVFCSSMADVFEDHPEIASQRERLWPLIAATPHLDHLLLTKRPENMIRFAPEAWREAWPANVWAGATVATQSMAEIRLPHLLRVPARVRFLSVEPMLSEVSLEEVRCLSGMADSVLGGECWGDCACDSVWGYEPGCRRNGGDGTLTKKVHWVICGGESGPKARPMDLEWARSLRDQCADARVPFFMKQLGEAWARESGTWNDDSHGGSPELWPDDLRVRETPVPHA